MVRIMAEHPRKNELLEKEKQAGELLFDDKIRPTTLDEYIGQDSVKSNLRVFISAAQKREEPLDHILLLGSAGLGKTTLASIISKEMHANMRVTSGPAIERPIDLLIMLKGLKEGDLLFIDEIHRLKRPIEEILYSAMEDFVIDRIINKGVGGRAIRIPLPKFTLIGATTRGGTLSSPLRARFGILFSLNFYTPSQLKAIILRTASILDCTITEEAALELAQRSRGTPRIANRLLKRVRDFADVKANGTIDLPLLLYALESMEIDSQGLDQTDLKILNALTVKYRGRAVGLDTLASSISEEPENIEEVYEPYLLQLGFIDRTSRGRVATEHAYLYLGLTPPELIPA